ncbi:unnamed protein product [marine sediment metagenome]|uniref:Uncharacterized protein n=1 Tax=marine sediment metagenome TaxID=412755 RepID=X1CVY2_9ZZZZ
MFSIKGSKAVITTLQYDYINNTLQMDKSIMFNKEVKIWA